MDSVFNMKTRIMLRIRKNSLVEELYLGRDGKWTTWKLAAKFSSYSACEKFAAKHGITTYGIF